jgi:hypothetical protein
MENDARFISFHTCEQTSGWHCAHNISTHIKLSTAMNTGGEKKRSFLLYFSASSAEGGYSL